MNHNRYRPSFTSNRKKLSKVKKKINPKPKAETKVTCSIPLETYNSKVKLFPSRCRLRKTNRTTAKISKYHILESKNTGQDICCNILCTDVGLARHYKNINLDSVIPALSPILELFKIRHNRFNYFDELKYIVENSQKKATQKYKNQIDIRLLQSFFNLLLYKTVPFELFGTLRNRKAVKKTMYHLLRTVPEKVSIESAFKRTVRKTKNVTGASLDLQPLFNKLDISNIGWLRSIDNSTVQWIIILKLLHWFFTQYIIKILHKYVVMKVIQKQWVYITKDNWCNMQEEFIKEKENTLSLVPYTKLNKKHIIGTYKFIPSSSGVRALFITKYNVKEKYDDIDVVLRFLQQLYVTHFNKNGIPTIASCRNEILDFIRSRSQNRLYFVSCDIQDAFGSIIQQKLYNIIVMCCEQLKEMYLAVRIFILSKTKRSQKKTVQILSNKLKKRISKNAFPAKEKPKLVQIKKLINKIYKFIFRQKVKLNDRLYSIKFGVPQGASVSPIFSDIYYQHMSEKILSEYAKNGLLCRYVDDIIYITENEHYATKFLEIIRNGIPEYNIKFNASKIKTNVGMPYKSMEIKFLKQISIKLPYVEGSYISRTQPSTVLSIKNGAKSFGTNDIPSSSFSE